eukprot:Nk52_evm3s271 gene=Nk52_evmTU3s271
MSDHILEQMATEPIEQVISSLSRLLAKLVEMNSGIPVTEITHFHAKIPPPISVEDYIKRLVKYCPCGNEVLILMLIYFDRVIQRSSGYMLTPLNIHRMLITAFMLASKFSQDKYYTNSHYGKVGGLPLSEINKLELEFLGLIDFELNAKVEYLREYYIRLLNFASPSKISQKGNSSAGMDENRNSKAKGRYQDPTKGHTLKRKRICSKSEQTCLLSNEKYASPGGKVRCQSTGFSGRYRLGNENDVGRVGVSVRNSLSPTVQWNYSSHTNKLADSFGNVCRSDAGSPLSSAIRSPQHNALPVLPEVSESFGALGPYDGVQHPVPPVQTDLGLGFDGMGYSQNAWTGGPTGNLFLQKSMKEVYLAKLNSLCLRDGFDLGIVNRAHGLFEEEVRRASGHLPSSAIESHCLKNAFHVIFSENPTLSPSILAEVDQL